MENALKSYKFVPITLSYKMTETLRSEACSVTTSLKEVRNKQNLTLEPKILHHSSIINSKPATQKEVFRLWGTLINN